MLSNFDIWSQAGGIDKAIVRQFPATVTDGVMTIDFIRRIENAKISAIEILPGCRHGRPERARLADGDGSATGSRLSWPAVDAATTPRATTSTARPRADGTFTQLNDATLTGTTYSRRRGSGRTLLLPGSDRRHGGNTSAPVAADAVRPVPLPAQVTGVQATGSQSGDRADLDGIHRHRPDRLQRLPVHNGRRHLHQAEHHAGHPRRTTTPRRLREPTSYYQVTAVNATGESIRSATASAARPVPVPARSPACRPRVRRAASR